MLEGSVEPDITVPLRHPSCTLVAIQNVNSFLEMSPLQDSGKLYKKQMKHIFFDIIDVSAFLDITRLLNFLGECNALPKLVSAGMADRIRIFMATSLNTACINK